MSKAFDSLLTGTEFFLSGPRNHEKPIGTKQILPTKLCAFELVQCVQALVFVVYTSIFRHIFGLEIIINLR